METEQNILNRLRRVEQIIVNLQSSIIEADSIMTEEDYESLLNYRKEKKAGALVSHSTIKKEFEA